MSSKPRVLGVDDNQRNLSILRRTLGGEFQFDTASSGDEALEEAQRLRPDIILLDIMMPGLDGYETCRRLRALPSLSSAKILMVSAKSMTAERLEGYAAGADDFIMKPFEPAELLAKVRVYHRLKSVEEVNLLKSNLLSLLGHETRTPLTMILSPLALLVEGGGLSDRQRELISVVDAGARRLTALVEKVAFLSQLKMGEIPFQSTVVDLGAIARDAAERVRGTAAEADVRLTLEAECPAPVRGDPDHLRWVVEALLDNAIRLSPAGGVVHVSTRRSDSHYLLAVTDSGPGIAEEMFPQLFEEFAVRDVDHHSRGHGLSLATSRLIVEKHGGKITAETGARLGGATFRVDLPTATVPAAASAAP